MSIDPRQYFPKAQRIKAELKDAMLDGSFGEDGSPFMTVRDLAEHTNVSLKTAHRIVGLLRDDGYLQRRGRRHYLTLPSAEMDMESNKVLIGLLVTCLENPFFSSLARQVEQCARQMGVELVIAASNYDATCEREKLDMFCRRGVSGILACPWETEINEATYVNLPVPYVLIGRTLKTEKADVVLVNNQMAAQKVARHFIESGFRDFAYVGPAGMSRDPRLLGFRNELVNEGLTLSDDHILQLDNTSPEQDSMEINKLIARRRSRLAVFCFHDLFAVRMLGACNRLGVRVPQEIAVAGFDNLPIASEVYPALTSVSYPIKDMAWIAFETLIGKLRSENRSRRITHYLESELLVRQSTQSEATVETATLPRNYLQFQLT